MRLLVLAGLVAAVLCAPRTSDACYNEVESHLTPVQEVATAERELERGAISMAAFRIRAQYPKIRTLDASAPPLAQRAERIYALALIRANGQLDHQTGWERWGNFEWALETLADLDAKRPNEPHIQADLAEARTRLSRTRAAGIAVLEDLDRRDLLGSPYAYLALARARAATGDEGGRTAALRRCEMMSSAKERCMTDLSGEIPDRRG